VRRVGRKKAVRGKVGVGLEGRRLPGSKRALLPQHLGKGKKLISGTGDDL